MKLHLPVRLRRALVSCMLVPAGVACSFSASAAGEELPADERANLGNTMYVGDSITNGMNGLYSWRWSMHKIFADNGISYTEVGVMTGSWGTGQQNAHIGTNMPYGDTVFLNEHSSQASARAWEIAERGTRGSRFEGTGIQHWLGLPEPDGWAGSSNSGFKLPDGSKPVETFLMLIGTNDLLSDVPTNDPHIGKGSRLADAEKNLIGRSENGGIVSWSGTGDMDTIVNAMFAHNPDASVTILSVPTWGSHGNNNAAEDYAAVRTYNEHLKEWVEQNKHKENITLVDINRGLVDVANTEKPWKGVDNFFYSSSDRLHPSAQGELIIAGNVARGLGYAGRTAGQERKAGADFSYEHHDAGSIWANAKSKSSVTQTSAGGLTFAAGSSMRYSWSEGVDTSGGYTVEFKLDGGLGNGSDGGWDTNNGLSVSVGNGKNGGCLTVNEAYIQWGDTVLFSLDTSSDLTESLRVAYVRGRASKGLSKGFYVWLGDQLIGEALSSNVTEAPDGLSVENGTNNSLTISDLYLDSAPWAPTTTGYSPSNPLIGGGGGKMPEAQYEDNPGVTDEWASVDDLLNGGTDAYDMTNNVGIGGVLEDGRYLGATVKSTTTSNVALNLLVSSSSYTYPLELYVTMDPDSTAEGYADVIFGSVSTKTASVRFLGGGYHNWFVVNSASFDGPLYMEFSPEKGENESRADLRVTALPSWATNNFDATYESHGKRDSVALTTFYQGSDAAPNRVAGEVRFVFNGGTFDGAIYGGNVYGASSDATVVGGGVHIYINGGTFTGNIYAGGTTGYIASSEITITGGLEDMDFTGVTRISAGGFGTGNAGGVADGGTAAVTLQNITADDGIANYEGEISGGRKPSGFEVRRTLALKNVKALKATLADFDEVQVEDGSIVQLKGLGGATVLSLGGESEMELTNPEESTVKEVTVGSGSKLTLRGGEYTGVVTTNGGEIVLEDGASYETALAKIDDDQVAMSTKGTYSIGAGSSLELGADADGRVRGAVDVNLFAGGTYRTSLTGEEEGGGSVLLHLQGADGGAENNVFTIQLVPMEGKTLPGTICTTLEGFASETRVKGWTKMGDYELRLMGKNEIVLGKSVLDTGDSIFDMKEARIQFEDNATLTVYVDFDVDSYPGEKETFEFAVLQGGDLGSWNGNEHVLLSQSVERDGWVARWTSKGTLALHLPSSDWGKSEYNSSRDNQGDDWKNGPGQNIYESVGGYSDVIVNSETEIDFSGVKEVPADYWGDGLEIHNLRGDEKGRLTITGDGQIGMNSKVTLKNKCKTETDGATFDGVLTYGGDLIVQGARLGILHEDTSDADNSRNLVTEVGGKLDLSRGMGLSLKCGILRLTGESSNLGDRPIEFENGSDGQLVIRGGRARVGGEISVSLSGEPGQNGREHIRLEEDGALELSGSAVVGAGVEIGGEGDATVLVTGKQVKMEGSKRITQDIHGDELDPPLVVESKLSGVHLEFGDGAKLELGESAPGESSEALKLLGLESDAGAGISGNRDMEVQLSARDHEFSGDLSEYKGTMTFKRSEWTQYFTPDFTPETGQAGGRNWNVTLQDGAKVHLSAIGSLTRINEGMNTGKVHVESGGELTLGFTFRGGVAGHTALEANFSFGDFVLDPGATLTLYAEGGNPTDREFGLGTVDGDIKLGGAEAPEARVAVAAAEDSDQSGKEEIEVEVKGDGLLHVDGAVVRKEGNRIVAEFKTAEADKLAEAVAGAHQNAQQGAEAVWEVTKQTYDPGSDLDKLAIGATRMLSEAKETGNSEALANTMAAAVGTGLAGLSPALSQDVHGRITALRNRTSGASWSEASDDLVENYPYYHVWVNGETNYHEMDDDGLASGYRLNSWGGSVGITAEVSDRTRVGLALTAMTGDYKCSAPDAVNGDLVTTWLGLFLSTSSGSWQHTLVFTGGIADVSINRTVACGGASYSTQGDTDGVAVGALYELGYTAYVNAEGTSALQAIFNAEWRYASVKGYTETGSNAGLQVEKMEQNVTTFGAGLRWQRLMSAAIANRNPLLELRALAKMDVGDDHGEVRTRFTGQQYTNSLRGAEVGAFGVEIGGEVSIPIGSHATRVFIDAGAELRSGYTSAEASIGLKTMF